MTFTIRSTVRRSALSTLTALTLVGPAVAQQPAAAPVPAPIVIPPNTCTKPSDFMPTFQSNEQLQRFQKSLEAYKSCVRDYVQANAAKSNELAAQARAYNEAANAAVNDINAYLTGLNEQTKNANEKSPATQGGAPKINP